MSATSSLRIIFAGTPDFAACHLRSLLASGHQVVAVYTQPDRPAGRGRQLSPSPVKQLATEHQLPVYQPESLKTEQAKAELATINADLMVVVAYGLLLPKAVLDTPRLGCINVHASLLPRWRGAAPIQRAIEAGDSETGVTIMQMDEGLDTGDMLLKASCPIAADDTAGSLHDRLAELGMPALKQTLDQLAAGTATPQAQDNKHSNYARKISKPELLIDWSEPALAIERKVRAFNPFPITYTMLGKDRIKIWKAHTQAGCSADPGTICQADKQGIVIGCGKNSLCVTQLQLPGGKALDVAAVMNSKAELFSVGTCLGENKA